MVSDRWRDLENGELWGAWEAAPPPGLSGVPGKTARDPDGTAAAPRTAADLLWFSGAELGAGLRGLRTTRDTDHANQEARSGEAPALRGVRGLALGKMDVRRRSVFGKKRQASPGTFLSPPIAFTSSQTEPRRGQQGGPVQAPPRCRSSPSSPVQLPPSVHLGKAPGAPGTGLARRLLCIRSRGREAGIYATFPGPGSASDFESYVSVLGPVPSGLHSVRGHYPLFRENKFSSGAYVPFFFLLLFSSSFSSLPFAPFLSGPRSRSGRTIIRNLFAKKWFSNSLFTAAFSNDTTSFLFGFWNSELANEFYTFKT